MISWCKTKDASSGCYLSDVFLGQKPSAVNTQFAHLKLGLLIPIELSSKGRCRSISRGDTFEGSLQAGEHQMNVRDCDFRGMPKTEAE